MSSNIKIDFGLHCPACPHGYMDVSMRNILGGGSRCDTCDYEVEKDSEENLQYIDGFHRFLEYTRCTGTLNRWKSFPDSTWKG